MSDKEKSNKNSNYYEKAIEEFESKTNEIEANVEKKVKKIQRNYKIAMGVTILVCTNITLTYVLVPLSHAQKVSDALKLQNVVASDENIEEIEKKLGKEIPGSYVKKYIDLSSGEDSISKIGDIFISSDGKSFYNTMENSYVNVIKDGKNIIVNNYETNNKIFADEDDIIDTISYSDLEENYVLSFEKNDDNTYSYKLVQKSKA